ncbi:RdgB/HAM1 family non-canonical purine NTP pyrophosphatase [Oscillospiraceae bacterium MB08-C2-2]|nr:RdgB/HAM1 family non-canonical purine NTP pyrophosphatase [Oscillospiraceae bacterium MB08-C2-2]
MEIVAATGNAHKLEEFQRILAPLGITVVSLAQAGTNDDGIVEDGETFAANARIKAQTIFQRTGRAVMADDSGLCINALEGRPGVLSARYMGEETSYPQKMAGILRELEGVPTEKRTASFVAAICCILPDGTVLETEGRCGGIIGYEPAGSGGFGYDPLFMVGERSFAELSPAEKDARSHRGKALEELYKKLEQKLRAGENV